MSPTVSREALHALFGPDAFAFGLFYAHAPALRFELSRGGHRLDQFEQAWDRAREIAGHALDDARELVVVASGSGDSPSEILRPLVRSLHDCGVPPGRVRAWWTEPHPHGDVPDPFDVRVFLAFACERSALHRLLWSALAVDLGVRPRLAGELYVADPARGILLHPYDDRGMDVIAAGAGRALLAELYHRFGAYLLDYDRARMDAFFAHGDPPGPH